MTSFVRLTLTLTTMALVFVTIASATHVLYGLIVSIILAPLAWLLTDLPRTRQRPKRIPKNTTRPNG